MKATRLSKDELIRLGSIMSQGNTALKQCAKMLGYKHRAFRGLVFSGKLDTSKFTVEQKAEFDTALPLIMAVKDQCEAKIRSNFYRLVVKQAKAAAFNNYDPHEAYNEFLQAGEFGLLNAIYSYTKTKFMLSTYVYKCVRREIYNSINRMNPFCPLTNQAIKLIQAVEEERHNHENPTDEMIVAALDFTDDEREIFFSATTKVVNEVFGDGSHDEYSDDYTSFRSGIDNDVKDMCFVRADVRQAMKDAELSDFELECVFSELYPYHGWKEDVAKHHISKRTGERYTRQNIQYAVERANKKIRNAYENPPKVHKENSRIDEFFEQFAGVSEK